MAESEGFEPPLGCPKPDFESGAFDHSANSPLFSLEYARHLWMKSDAVHRMYHRAPLPFERGSLVFRANEDPRAGIFIVTEHHVSVSAIR